MFFRSSTTGMISAIALVIGLGAEVNAIEFSGAYETNVILDPFDLENPPSLQEALPQEYQNGIPPGVIESLPEDFQAGLPEGLEIPKFLLNSPANISLVNVTGTLNSEASADDVFGLTEFDSRTYGLQIPLAFAEDNVSPTVVLGVFRGDPAAFGLTDLPVRTDRYFGSTNELFGVAADQAIFDFTNGRVSGFGAIAITGGEGQFENATGTIDFTQNDLLGPNVVGRAELDYSVQVPETVPEPSANAALIGLGMISAVWLRRRYC